MNFCFLAWPETAHIVNPGYTGGLARRLLFGKQVVSRTNICKGRMQMGGEPFPDHADENNNFKQWGYYHKTGKCLSL